MYLDKTPIRYCLPPGGQSLVPRRAGPQADDGVLPFLQELREL
jgi:hypothetical protein